MAESKPFWKSWQVWLAFAVTVLEPVQSFVLANPLPEPAGKIVVSILGVAMLVARSVSDGKTLTLTPPPK